MNKIWEVRVSTSKNIGWFDMEYPPKIITKWQKLYSPPRKLRAGNQLPVLFLEKLLCTRDLLPACKIFIERLGHPCQPSYIKFWDEGLQLVFTPPQVCSQFFWSSEHLICRIPLHLYFVKYMEVYMTYPLIHEKTFFFWCSFAFVKEGAIYFFSIYFSLFLQIF